jgi:hypothetical protein
MLLVQNSINEFNTNETVQSPTISVNCLLIT